MKHGTRGAYTNHGCRCDECMEAARIYRRQYQKTGSGARPGYGKTHGLSGYSHRKCRCSVCTGARKWHVIKTRYRVTREEVESKLLDQEGRCPICLSGLDLNKGGWVVDHCHKSGTFRGVLCPGCNTAIGKFQDSLGIVEKAKEYLD